LLARLTEQKEVRSVEVNKGAVVTYGLLMKKHGVSSWDG
jgi:hypothetical protein